MLFSRRNKAVILQVNELSCIPTVKFDPRRVTAAVEVEIRSTLQAVQEIGVGKLAFAYEAALRSVRAGRDVGLLRDALVGIGLAKPHASEIAGLVNNRATSLMNREQQRSLGITEAVWIYSGAPCGVGKKTPWPEEERRNADHFAADGKRFAVAEGLLMRGRRIWPGQDPGCKCISRSVIPGLASAR